MRRHLIPPRPLGALLVAAGATACLALPSPATAGPGLLPDLVADTVTATRSSRETPHGATGTRLLLRFDGYVHNIGAGRLEIHARSPVGSFDGDTLRMSDVRQRIYDAGGDLVQELPSQVHFPHAGPHAAAYHHHWHTDFAASYTLVRGDTGEPVKESAKYGFCLADSETVDVPGDTPHRYSGEGCSGLTADGLPVGDSVDADHVIMGISAGFRDVYAAHYWTQWVDLTDAVPPGTYAIRTVADPTGVIVEADEVNPPDYSDPFTLRGWVATSLSAPAGASGAPQTITLAARRVVGTGLGDDDALMGDPGPVTYALDRPPAHGTVTLSGASAVYTPHPGYSGPDAFTFTAGEDGTMLARPAATVSLQVLPATPATPTTPTTPTTPAPARPARPGSGARFTLSARQLLINQRIGQAAIRRLNAVRATLDGRPAPSPSLRSTAGAVHLSAAQLLINQRIFQAAIRRAAILEARLDDGPAPRSGRGPGGAVHLTVGQMRINQRIAQAAVRRANALVARVGSGPA